jgi:hypothetical protein
MTSHIFMVIHELLEIKVFVELVLVAAEVVVDVDEKKLFGILVFSRQNVLKILSWM